MKRLILKLSSALLIAVMLTCSPAAAAMAVSAQPAGEAPLYKGAYYYRPVLGEYDGSADAADQYIYSDGFFSEDAGVYNEHLATFSMLLAETSVSSNREPDTEEGYKNKSRNAAALLEDNGFTDIETNDDYRSKPTAHSIGLLCAHKSISVSGSDYTLLCVVPRSAGYEKEWISNFTIGSKGDLKGFDDSAEKCLSYIRAYIRDRGITGKLKVWTAGFSRGAGVTNLIDKKLIDDPEGFLGEGVTLSGGNLYGYNFAVPKAAWSGYDPRDGRYASVYNLSADTELPSKIAPTNMGFERYGSDLTINNNESYDKMLSMLKIRSEYLHGLYTESYSPRLFKPKKFALNDGELSITDDDDSYIPDDPAEFLEDFASYLTYVTGGRAKYQAEFEQPVSYLIGYLGTLNSDGLSAFINSASANEDTPYLAAAMYAYFMRYKAKYGKLSYADEAGKALADTSAANSDIADTSALSGLAAKISLTLAVYMLRSPESLKSTAADYLGKVLSRAMDAAGATDEEKSVLLSKSSLSALTHFLSFLLLGNIRQSNNYRPFDVGNEQLKNAATLIGNAANLVADHSNEAVVSWLRAADSFYDDYAPLSQAQLKGYRRVYISAPESVRLDGKITDDSGDTVAVIQDGRLISSSDSWVGYTSSDNGGFFRIPADKSYHIYLDCSGSCDISVRIGEYTCYDAKCVTVMDKTVSATPRDTVTIKLPMLFTDYSVPSGAKYNAYIEEGTHTILGDADSDGEVTAVDATAVSRTVLRLPCAVFDKLAADADGDGDITVVDATFIQRRAINVPVPYPIGERIE